jgi:hypothetical protein
MVYWWWREVHLQVCCNSSRQLPSDTIELTESYDFLQYETLRTIELYETTASQPIKRTASNARSLSSISCHSARTSPPRHGPRHQGCARRFSPIHFSLLGIVCSSLLTGDEINQGSISAPVVKAFQTGGSVFVSR